MRGKKSRNKGQRGERELFSLLSNELGFIVNRNLSQTRAGGSDCVEIPGWSVEVKRQERIHIESWWSQAVLQSEIESKRPILFFRENHAPWRACVSLHELSPDIFIDREFKAIISFLAACELIRKSLNDGLLQRKTAIENLG